MKDLPNGYNLYLVKTADGGIYLIGSSHTKNGVRYWTYEYGSLKEEDIAEWVGIDDKFFEKNK